MMQREIKAIKRREAEMSRQYGIYATCWEEDWPMYYALKSNLAFYREKFKNKFEIFETFKFVITFICAIAVFIVIACATKNIAVFLAGLFGSILAILLWFYLYYFVFVKNQIRNLQKIIGAFYIKYDRRVLKSYLTKYKQDERPPKPISALFSEDYFSYDLPDTNEDVGIEHPTPKKAEKKVKQEKEHEAIVVEEEKPDDKEEKAVSGIDLRLVGNSDKPGSDPVEPDISDSLIRTEEEVFSDSGKPEPTVREESSEGSVDEPVEEPQLSADAITVCDNAETAQTVYLGPDDHIEDEEEIDLIFSDYREDTEDDLAEKDSLTSSQWLKFYENLDDTEDEPKEEPEEEDNEKSEEKTEAETETSEEEFADGAEEESEDETQDTDDSPAEEKGSERLFAEGYIPTTEELLAAIRSLRS